MISILEYIIFIFKKYNNFSEYFIGEIGNNITVFQFFNCVTLNIILLYFFIRFFIKTWGFCIKKFSRIIITRLLLVNILLLSVYIISDFTMCETEINKASVSYLNNFNIDDTKKKYIAITCFAIIGGYLLYKYIPIYLDSLKPQNNFLIEKYKYQTYQDWIIFYNDSKKIYDRKHELFTKKQSKLEELQYYINVELDRFSIFRLTAIDLHKIFLPKYRDLIKEEDFLHFSDVNGFSYRQEQIENNLIKIKEKMIYLMGKNIPADTFYASKIVLDFDALIDNEIKMLETLVNLNVLYNKYWDQYDSAVEGGITSCTAIIEFTHYVDNHITIILNHQNDILRMFEESSRLTQILPYLDTSSCKLDLPLEYMHGIKFFVFNISYIIFYPTYFVFNKVLGVHNPFSLKIFKDSIWYFITLKMFF
jgi:hypothetical protein